MWQHVSKWFFAVFKFLLFCCIGGFAVILTAFILFLQNQPELKVWHKVRLTEEFTTHSAISSFHEYLQLEDRLFDELHKKVYEQVATADRNLINRYAAGSRSDPDTWPVNWNRTISKIPAKPKSAILLLHGMSDSPYLMRNLALKLYEAGNAVVILRLPGHGTAPSGLVHVRWQDMAQAVTLAMQHLQKALPEIPKYMIGFSTGGALSINYTLDALVNQALPVPKNIVLLSPAIGLGPEAALAIWQDRLGSWFGLDKLAWNAVLPEYDPFKYNSFAINAGDLVYRLTLQIEEKLSALDEGLKSQFPAVLAFQSLVDATVSTQQLAEGLFDRLQPNGHELVLFDINRQLEVEYLLNKDPNGELGKLLDDPDLPFAISLLSNANSQSKKIVLRHKNINSIEITVQETLLEWPLRIFSLSHVALPIPYEDPLYGGSWNPRSKRLHLGDLALRGEKGVLQLTGIDMLRLRWNPFYPYVKQRIFEYLGFSTASVIKKELKQLESKQVLPQIQQQ